MARLANRIKGMPDSRWPKKILRWDLSLKSNGWADQLLLVLQHAHVEFDINDDSLIDLESLKNQYLVINRQKWLLEASEKTKLRTFLEVYDPDHPRAIVESLLPRNQRSLVAKLKTGVLPLKLETGRWKDSPLEHRLCIVCDDKKLENEYHFLVHCTAYDEIRDEFVERLVEKGVHVSSDSEQEFVKSILSKEALKVTGKYIEIMYGLRRQFLPHKSTSTKQARERAWT